ncbi:protease inhibitor I42 family protein [Chloroflexota bacterium]
MLKSKWFIGILSLSLITILFVACNATDDQTSKAWVEITCDEFSTNHHFNQALEVRAGEIFEVKLCSNPSTGFQWSEGSQISDTIVLKQEKHEFVGLESEPPPPPGTPGQEIWTFKALKQGSSTIYLEYSRPWEGGEKGEWTLTVDVIVK